MTQTLLFYDRTSIMFQSKVVSNRYDSGVRI